MEFNKLNSFCFFVLFTSLQFVLTSCKEDFSDGQALIQEFDYSIDTSEIPQDTVKLTDAMVSYSNGLYLLMGKPFSGIVYQVLKGYDVQAYSSVLKGKLHGTYQSFYKSGKPYEIRQYRNGFSVGLQVAFWETTGKKMYEYNYYNDKQEGVQKSWYETGEPFFVYNYKDDKLNGFQKAWRINGSLYRNFEAKNGVNYGLQNSMQCNELKDETLKNIPVIFPQIIKK